jgi:RNA polymerase sigma-70 factor (ECF subfamily)
MEEISYHELIAHHQKRLHHFIYSLVGNQENAWDILQEVNLVLLRKEDAYERGTSFKAWSNTIARFQAINFCRKAYNRKTDLVTPELIEIFADDIEESHHYEEEEMRRKKSALTSCKQKLNAKNSRIIGLFYEEELPIKKISQVTGMKENAIKQALRRARITLQSCIEKKLKYSTS